MRLDEITREAVSSCLHDRVPFVLYSMPGEDECHFYASILPFGEQSSRAFRGDGKDCFFINFFDNDEPYTAGVRFDLSAEEFMKVKNTTIYPDQPPAEIRPRVSPTLRASYHDAFARVIPRLKAEGAR